MLLFHIFNAAAFASCALGYGLQAPALPGAPPISPEDRLYTGDQSSNTITVIKPSTNEVLGTIAIGDSRMTDVLGPQYLKVINSHGMGFSRDGKYIVSLSVSSNTVTVIRLTDNTIQSQTSVDRQSHEAFFSADNRTVWVGCRGTNYVDVVDGIEGGVLSRIETQPGPSKVLFSPDGNTAYVNHILSPTVTVIDVPSQTVVDIITGLAAVFSSDMMLDATGTRLWVAHKMTGQVSVIDLVSRSVIDILFTGPETNHPNFAIVNGTTFAYVTVAAENSTKVYRQDTSASTPVFIKAIRNSGIEPHPVWPSPDNTRMYVALQHSDSLDIIDTSSLSVIDTLHIGQDSQSVVYVAGAVPSNISESVWRSNLGRQGLSEQVVNFIVPIESNATESPAVNGSALITLRQLPGLDMVQVIGRHLRENVTYLLSASPIMPGTNSSGQVRIPLYEFNATTPGPYGCETAPEVVGFMKVFDVYSLDSFQIEPMY